MGTVTSFFLGANGDYHLFRQLAEEERFRDLIILKGCPGGGTRAFIQRIGAAVEKVGADVEYLRCGGDPALLDGLLLPGLRCGVAQIACGSGRTKILSPQRSSFSPPPQSITS